MMTEHATTLIEGLAKMRKVSSKGVQLAAQWQKKAVVRRFKLEMAPPLADSILVPPQQLSRPTEPRRPTLNST